MKLLFKKLRKDTDKTILNNPEKTLRVYIRVICRLYYLRYGSGQRARQEFYKLMENKKEIDESVIRQIFHVLYFYKLIHAIKPILETKGFIDLIRYVMTLRESLEKVYKKIKEEDRVDFIEYYNRIVNNKASIIKILEEGIPYTEKDIKKIISNTGITNKELMSKELNVDKTTFNKWLKHFFKEKYFNVRKFTIKEYAKILSKLILKEGETLKTIDYNSDEIRERLNNDLVHNRASILKLSDMKGIRYSELKESLKLINFDSDIKKIPYSMKNDICKHLDIDDNPLKPLPSSSAKEISHNQ